MQYVNNIDASYCFQFTLISYNSYVNLASCSSQSSDSLKRLCLLRLFTWGRNLVKDITSDSKVEFDEALVRRGKLAHDAETKQPVRQYNLLRNKFARCAN